MWTGAVEHDDCDMIPLPPLDLSHDLPSGSSFASSVLPPPPPEQDGSPKARPTNFPLVLGRSVVFQRPHQRIITAARICGVQLPATSSSSLSTRPTEDSLHFPKTTLWVYHSDEKGATSSNTTPSSNFPLPATEQLVSGTTTTTAAPLRQLLQHLPAWLTHYSASSSSSSSSSTSPVVHAPSAPQQPPVDGVAWTQSVTSLAYLPHWVHINGTWVRYRDTHPIATFFQRLSQLLSNPTK